MYMTYLKLFIIQLYSIENIKMADTNKTPEYVACNQLRKVT